MVTAGPTREAIDAVRFISNRSSGKMGFAIAGAAREAGANVTLVSGPVSLATPEGVTRLDVETAQQMGQQVLDRVDQQDILIGAAAVADYLPATYHEGKLKKSADDLSIRLAPSIDIMLEVGKLPRRPFTVGFAAETDNLEQYAQEKRLRKNMDMIAANPVGGSNSGFEVENNMLDLYWEGGSKHLELAHKNKIARQLIDEISIHFHQRAGQQDG